MELKVTAAQDASFLHDEEVGHCEGPGLIFIDADKFIDRLDGAIMGCYQFLGKKLTFSACQYLCFEGFLETLAQHVLNASVKDVRQDPHTYIDKPFFELIFFDYAGAIGHKTSQKLADDFRQYKKEIWKKILKGTTVENFLKNGRAIYLADWDCQYKLWQDAFDFAAQRGFVVFEYKKGE